MRPLQHVLAESLGWEPHPSASTRGAPTGGNCGWCGESGPLFKALPAEFTQWDVTGIRPQNPWMCTLCAAAIGHLKPVRWGHVEVTAEGATMSSDPRDLRQWLAKPVRPDRAILVQTNRQKRSLFSAEWGRVATSYDGVNVPWWSDDTVKLAAHERLRWEHGVSEAEIQEAVPRPSTIQNSPDARALFDLWGLVKAWDVIHLEISLLATRRTEKKK